MIYTLLPSGTAIDDLGRSLYEAIRQPAYAIVGMVCMVRIAKMAVAGDGAGESGRILRDLVFCILLLVAVPQFVEMIEAIMRSFAEALAGTNRVAATASSVLGSFGEKEKFDYGSMASWEFYAKETLRVMPAVVFLCAQFVFAFFKYVLICATPFMIILSLLMGRYIAVTLVFFAMMIVAGFPVLWNVLGRIGQLFVERYRDSEVLREKVIPAMTAGVQGLGALTMGVIVFKKQFGQVMDATRTGAKLTKGVASNATGAAIGAASTTMSMAKGAGGLAMSGASVGMNVMKRGYGSFKGISDGGSGSTGGRMNGSDGDDDGYADHRKYGSSGGASGYGDDDDSSKNRGYNDKFAISQFE